MDLRLFRHGDKAFGIHGPAQDGAHWRRTVVAEERGLAVGRAAFCFRPPTGTDIKLRQTSTLQVAVAVSVGRCLISYTTCEPNRTP